MSQQTETVIEDEIEFDENDNKIIQLYEVINELIDDQKARIEDMELLYNDKSDIVLENVEHRNNSILNQIYNELQLKERTEEEEDNNYNTESDESEDEQDQGWEIYNTIVSNLNGYMAQIALFGQKLKDENKNILSEEEIKELEIVIEQQTIALEQQMKRNQQLENALQSVLNEYTNRLNIGNNEITSLHKQLSLNNKQHSKQIQSLKNMYEKKIKQLQENENNEYKQEVSKLIDSLSSSRNDFQKQIIALTQEMSDAQTNHHKEMLTLTQYNQTLTESLAEKTLLLEEIKQKQYNKPQNIKKKLKKYKTILDIDDGDDYDDDTNVNDDYHANGNGNIKKKRTFTPSGYTSAQITNDINELQTPLQAKYNKYKSNKTYKSRNKGKYSQRGY